MINTIRGTDRDQLVTGSLVAGSGAPLNGKGPVTVILVQNDPTNATDIRVGDSSAQNVRLQPGESISFDFVLIEAVFVTAVSGSPVVNWLGRRQ